MYCSAAEWWITIYLYGVVLTPLISGSITGLAPHSLLLTILIEEFPSPTSPPDPPPGLEPPPDPPDVSPFGYTGEVVIELSASLGAHIAHLPKLSVFIT